jgi:hypothetical protein
MKRVLLICGLTVAVICAVTLVQWEAAPIAAEQKERESYAHRDGNKEAEIDIAQGVLKWKVLGRVSNFEEERATLKAKLGVELDWFADCLSTEEIERYRREYNRAMRAHLVTRFGEDAVRQTLGTPQTAGLL